jgi:hypothetical protein
MIIDALLDIGFGVAAWFVALLPVVNLDCSGASALGGYLSWVDSFVDLSAFAQILASEVGVEVGIVAAKAVVWVYRLIPFKFS